MDARVSTWKERIESALEEHDKNQPFDIGSYGEKILDTLSSRTNNARIASFSEIVSGKPKYEIARTFSAILQLVTGRSVDLEKGQATNELVSYTTENPFHVRIIGSQPEARSGGTLCPKDGQVPTTKCRKDNESSVAQHECPKKSLRKNGKIPVKASTRLTNRACWSAMQSYNLLKWHKKAHIATVKAR
ncbi:Condensin-2 complex subunit H2 [Zea mays]|uniref:Condensin-2 complex subunit H2 n=1 Tax=Zea mays TaxID=4577 RepID=A0A1D6LJ87_MAIZE|nr:Condensin-2 complex subunit H2 [Zea mays]